MRRFIFCIVLIAGLMSSASATQQVHLPGVVEILCPDEQHCFELRVEAEYIDIAGA